jgi:hypothetical protein
MVEENKLTENDAKAFENAFGVRLAMSASLIEVTGQRADPNPTDSGLC